MAAILNLQIQQGTSFETEVTIEESSGVPLDLSGFTLRSEMRKHYTSANTTATFVASTLAPVAGKLTLGLTAATTAAIKAGRYLYDVEIVSAGTEDGLQTITITDGGTGYTNATVAITGGGGSGATATAVPVNGAIDSIVVTAPGTGYTSDPLITITGNGASATATAVRGGKVSRVVEGICTVSPEITKS